VCSVGSFPTCMPAFSLHRVSRSVTTGCRASRCCSPAGTYGTGRYSAPPTSGSRTRPPRNQSPAPFSMRWASTTCVRWTARAACST
jgi:hypothetical protein